MEKDEFITKIKDLGIGLDSLDITSYKDALQRITVLGKKNQPKQLVRLKNDTKLFIESQIQKHPEIQNVISEYLECFSEFCNTAASKKIIEEIKDKVTNDINSKFFSKENKEMIQDYKEIYRILSSKSKDLPKNMGEENYKEFFPLVAKFSESIYLAIEDLETGSCLEKSTLSKIKETSKEIIDWIEQKEEQTNNRSFFKNIKKLISSAVKLIMTKDPKMENKHRLAFKQSYAELTRPSKIKKSLGEFKSMAKDFRTKLAESRAAEKNPQRKIGR